MFKKSKSNKNIVPPSAPTLDEVMADIETFQVDIDTVNRAPTHNYPDNTTSTTSGSLDDWWIMFEQFMRDLKCLEIVHSEVEGFKLKLESKQLEIDTEVKMLKKDLDTQQQQIKEALEGN